MNLIKKTFLGAAVLPFLMGCSQIYALVAQPVTYKEFHTAAQDAMKKRETSGKEVESFSVKGYQTVDGKKTKFDFDTKDENSISSEEVGIVAAVALIIAAVDASSFDDLSTCKYFLSFDKNYFRIDAKSENESGKMEFNEYGILTSFYSKSIDSNGVKEELSFNATFTYGAASK